MSLTSIYRDKQRQDLRDKFSSEFLKPAFNLSGDIKALPTKNYAICGTALDYLLRFTIEKETDKKIIEKRKWVAEHAYDSLERKLENLKSELFKTSHKTYNRQELLDYINGSFYSIQDLYSKYIKNGKPSIMFFQGCLFLAKLDVLARAGVIDPGIDDSEIDDIFDLQSMLGIFSPDLFKAKKKCFLNPHFGLGSTLVGGADADLVIDDTLIDIKTSRHLKLSRNDFDQLIGYYILSLIGGINGNEQIKPIKKIGIYFARYGQLWTIALDQIADNEKFENFKNWFVSYMTKGEMDLNGFKDLIEGFNKKYSTKTTSTDSTQKANTTKTSIKRATVKKVDSKTNKRNPTKQGSR